MHPALDLMVHRLNQPWSVDRLAQSFGVSGRTLHRVFRRQYGMSPMLLLRRVRLAEVRRRLEAPAAGSTVTAVALDCGFTHLGRFSADYAREFGETPSETLRRARRVHQASALPAISNESALTERRGAA